MLSPASAPTVSSLQLALLEECRQRDGFDLREISEATRQALIALGMHEPPLVEVDADRVTITKAGELALDAA